jgi:GT2 family glycosyltransferase
VIVARDAASSLPATVASVIAQGDIVREIVVAVPAADSATRAAISGLDARGLPVRVVDNPSGRTPDGLNAAIHAASAEFVARVDAHAELPAGYLEAAVAILRANERVGNVGGIQHSVGKGPLGEAIAAAMQSPVGSGGAFHRTGTTAGAVDTVYLGVFRRAALDDVGAFDTRFTRNQDYELNVRLRRAGWLVWFDPSLVVAYKPRPSLRRLARQYLEYGRWRRATMALHPGSWRLRQLALPVAFVLFLLASFVGVVTGLPFVGPALLAAWLLVVLAAGIAGGGGANPLFVAAAIATMHAAWTAGWLLGPPRGWRGGPSGRGG